MQLTEEMILDTIENLKRREEYNQLEMNTRGVVGLYLSQMGLELRRKLNDN